MIVLLLTFCFPAFTPTTLTPVFPPRLILVLFRPSFIKLKKTIYCLLMDNSLYMRMLVFFLVSPPPPPFFDLYENRRFFSFPTFSPASSPNFILHFSSFPLILSFTASSFLFPPSIPNIYLSFISHFTRISTSFGLPRSQSRSLFFSFHFQYLYLSFFIGLVPRFFDFSTCLVDISLCCYSIPIFIVYQGYMVLLDV